MRKLKLQTQISVDGYVAGLNGEMDWMTWNWDDKLKDYVGEITAPVDCVLLGRKMTDGFIKHWAAVAANPQDHSHTAGRFFTDVRKVVFTKTLDESEWPNTDLAKGELAEEINKLKQAEGGDIIVYGGAGFVSSLIEAGLIDELQLFVNPAAIGNGLKIFTGKTKLAWQKTLPFECGINVMVYKPVT